MTESVSYEDFSKICRLCLKTNKLKPIFSIPEFIHNLKCITAIKVIPNDKLPKSVCSACVEKVDCINCFIESCRNNDAILKTVVIQEDKSALQDLQAKFVLGGIKTELPVEEIQVKEEPCDENEITAKIVNDEHLTDRNVLTVKKTNEKEKQEMFTCDQREEVLHSLVSFRSHMENHKKSEDEVPKKRNDKCKCIYCSKYFTRKTDLKRHLRIHTSVKFTQKTSLDRHNFLHTGKFTCKVCYMPFTRESHLKDHMKIHNRNAKFTSLNPLRCRFCGKIFSSKRYLTGHMRMHMGIKDFECDICHKTFPVKDSLIRHRLSHMEIKAFKCDQCSAAFKRNMLLEKHKKVHDENSEEKKRLSCVECGKCFLFPSYLRRHAAVHCPDQKALIQKAKSRPRKPGQCLCSYCGKQFTQMSHLRVHVRIHTGERFNCEICNNSYSTNDSLKIHQGEKPYPCVYCSKLFRKLSLYKHLLIHKDIRQCKCNICKKTFIRKDQLNQHHRIHS